MDAFTTIMLLIVFLVSGVLCGMMFNIALGLKPFDRGGIMGGIVVGLLMFAI
ncbi:MAG: hypothetical protein JSW25_00055 [Thermoplasmata archaeon]|nr:MAG: hypothetical protein JSW25_00055 [Thermoplasmata archaeon]